MIKNFLHIIIESAEHSFTGVTAFVGTVLILISYINYLQANGLIRTIKHSKRFQPIIGSILGLTPGCGGSIFIIPLFPKGIVSFGTVVATLIASMGDSSFILISKMPITYLFISIISFLVAVITGYIVDRLPIGNLLLKDIQAISKYKNEDKESPTITNEKIEAKEKNSSLSYKLRQTTYIVYWVLIFSGLIFGFFEIFQINIETSILHDISLFIGILGTIITLVINLTNKKSDHNHSDSIIKTSSLKDTLLHNAKETASIGSWVFIAFLVYEVFVISIGRGDYILGQDTIMSFLTTTGISSVILGALIGVIPGCGPQIIFTALYTKGVLPFAALLANAISQDGDALFPLIAIHKKSAIWATIFNLIPSLIVGIIVYFIEIKFF